jgi:nitrite reductase/ring-hydroxylating ferredoxin subunit
MSETNETATPDLSQGIAASVLADGDMMLGRVGDDEVVLARSGTELFAIGAHCTHYRGPLVKGLVVDDTVRCPLHHACFSLRTGEALRAPALDPIACWRVEREGDRVFVREKAQAPRRSPAVPAKQGQTPSSIVIVGGGAAGAAAAEMIRRESYEGPVTMISADVGSTCRSSEPVEGLPRRRSAGRLDSTLASGVLCGPSHRVAAGSPRVVH